MAKTRGKDAQTFITDAGGTSREITTFIDSFDDELGRETYDTTNHGAGGRSRTGGFIDFTGSMGGKWDNGGSATPEHWLTGLIKADGTVTSRLTNFPNGSAAGRPYAQANVFFSNYGHSEPYDDVVTWSVDFELADGTVTNGTA